MKRLGVYEFIVTSGGGLLALCKVYSRLITMHVHDTHPAVIKRLRRAGGHLTSVVKMLEDGKPCLDVVQQLQAVEKAITQAKKTLIQDHLDHCLNHMVDAQGQTQPDSLDEFRQITKYL
jgi:DNA-binding FrmR family transcriptional regulator